MPTVARINLTPVKSTALLHPDQVELSEDGVEGDHLFLFLDATGHRLSGADKAPLLGIKAAHDPKLEKLTLALPNGTRVRGPARPTGAAFKTPMFDREIEVRPVPGPIEDAVSRYLGKEVQLVRAQPGQRGGGAAPVSLLSRSAVTELGRRAGRKTPDARRFRMLFELDGCRPNEEDEWVGVRTRIGGAIVRISDPAMRCVLTDMNPETGAKDFPCLATLGTYRRAADGVEFGRYATILLPGLVKVGDVVEPEG
jgi:uncharacterized protein YcbX